MGVEGNMYFTFQKERVAGVRCLQILGCRFQRPRSKPRPVCPLVAQRASVPLCLFSHL